MQRLIADGLAESAALQARIDALQDALNETRYPIVAYDDPSWDDADRWTISPAIPPGTAIVPPELVDDDDIPFLIAASA
jgi:hypothetical protein